MHSLPLFHRISGQPVIVLGEGDMAEAKRRLVERAGGMIVGAHDPAARLAFVALDRPEQAAADLRARGVLVNVADRPELCDFTLPSLLERDPVLIAIGTGGASAGLAKALRLRLEALLPNSVGALAAALRSAQEQLRAKWPDTGERRRALDAALTSGGPLDPLQDGSNLRLDPWLAGTSDDGPKSVEIHLASDDPDDLTLRQLRWLGSADLIAHDPGIAPQVLARARADAVRQELRTGTSPARSGGLTVIIRAR